MVRPGALGFAAREPRAIWGDLTGGPPHSLPAQPGPCVGREREIGAIRTRILSRDVRLLTLTGPPGVGKTRLVLEVAEGLTADFRDGTYFVDLTGVNDSALAVRLIAQTLAIRAPPDEPPFDQLKQYLRRKSVLLILDGFERLLADAPHVAELLRDCRGVRILATSRAPLRVTWEREVPVVPLSLPDLTVRASPEILQENPSVRLFVERARAIIPEFALSAPSARDVAEICVRLDGLPLAIGLAAARVRLLSPAAMLERLERRLTLLTGGARDEPERHRTLRAAIAWSHDLLDEGERTLFRRLSACAGGISLEAAAALCGDAHDGPIDVLETGASLVDKSLLQQEDTGGEPRFKMLETIREFGLEQLDAAWERNSVRARHAAFFLAMADRARACFGGPDERQELAGLEVESGNLRTALEWFIEQGEAQAALQVTEVLLRFWR